MPTAAMASDDLQAAARKLGLSEDDPAVMRDLQTLTDDASQPKQEWGMRAMRPRPTGKANRLAVFALFCAFVAPVLGIVFGVVALDEIEDTGGTERGVRMAQWAVGIGGVLTVLAAVAAIWLATRIG
jgi:hypothetical protein